uniref:Uncharacterized protein n=1 Tax=Glossina palpalis gambiensis TaxID=67801 RepID=A0A1B0BWS8_9MUSC
NSFIVSRTHHEDFGNNCTVNTKNFPTSLTQILSVERIRKTAHVARGGTKIKSRFIVLAFNASVDCAEVFKKHRACKSKFVIMRPASVSITSSSSNTTRNLLSPIGLILSMMRSFSTKRLSLRYHSINGCGDAKTFPTCHCISTLMLFTQIVLKILENFNNFHV